MIRNLIIYIVMLVLMFLIATLYPGFYMTLALEVMLIIPVISLIVMILAYKKTQYSITLKSKTVEKGDYAGLPIEFRIKTKSILAIIPVMVKVKYKNRYQQKISKEKLSVNGCSNSEVTTTYYLYAQNAGVIDIEFTTVYFYDWLKLFRIAKKINVSEQLAALPEYREVSYVPAEIRDITNVETDIFSEHKSGSDRSQVFDIRQYREGDSIRDVHWKLSGKKEELYVKEFSQPIMEQFVIFVELIKGEDAEVIDNVLSVARSMSEIFIKNSAVHYFAWYDKERQESMCSKIEKEEDVITTITDVMYYPLYDEPQGMSRYRKKYHMQKANEVFYITSRCDVELITGLHIENEDMEITIIIVADTRPYDWEQLLECCEYMGIKLMLEEGEYEV